MSEEQILTLTELAEAIIPADARDEGAAAVNAGARLAQRVDAGVNTNVYLDGLNAAQQLASTRFSKNIFELGAGELHEMLGLLRERAPAFYKQLRTDVSALYLSDPAVWRRIGFPGPSIERGGYPDFDQPQETAGDSGPSGRI